jgi:nucleotide-binding universal stress UspA family protein/CBS-domain-containing membrane protein
MFTTIVVALDGSRPADAAADVALWLAKLSQAQVIFVSVIEEQPRYVSVHEEAASENASARDYFSALHARWERQALLHGVAARSVTLTGHEAQRILRYAADSQADLLVMGHAGHSAVWEGALGGTAQQLLLRAPCSALVVRAHEGRRERIGPLAVALDGSPVGWEAFDRALDLAALSRHSLTVISVVERAPTSGADDPNASGVLSVRERPTVTAGPVSSMSMPGWMEMLAQAQARAVGRAARLGVSLELVTIEGPVSDALVRATREREISLLILGATGHERPWSATAGGTARKVAEEARCAVLLARPGTAASTVADVMRSATVTLRPDQPLLDALTLLLDGEARLLPVTDAQGILLGILTLTTLVNRLRPALSGRQSHSPEDMRAMMERLLDGRLIRDAMITRVQTVRPETPLPIAARFLISHRLTRAPVVDDARRLLGILSEQEIIHALTAHGREAESASEPAAITQEAATEPHAPTTSGITVASVVDRSVPVIAWDTPIDDALSVVGGAARGLAVVVDLEGRYAGVIDEHSTLARTMPRDEAWPGALARLLGRASLLAGRGGASHIEEPITTRALTQRSIPTFTPDQPVADALARMISGESVSDAGVALAPDGRPIGVVWRQTALRALIRG